MNKVINGVSCPKAIADEFSNYFQNICKPNNHSFDVEWQSKFKSDVASYFGDHLTSESLFTTELVGKIVAELKTGRAAGIDGLTAEHLLYCHPAAIVIICYLCNLMLISGHVPSQFAVGLTHPIPKCKYMNKVLTCDDYRGITISPVISKIFEKGILVNFESYFLSSDNQFGFKKKLGCSHALFCLRSTVDYFVSRNSNVNICSLDISKAFDRVNHYCLFSKLMSRRLPVSVIMLLYRWYNESSATVVWNGVRSSIYRLHAGVRQGGVLSPVFFAIFVNSVIIAVERSGLGCRIGFNCLSIIMYADDLLLISSSITHLKQLIDICISEFNKLDLAINGKKSGCIRFGVNYANVCNDLVTKDATFSWTDCLNYLGNTLISAKRFSVDLKPVRVKFYRSFNAIYGKISKANESLIVSLMKTFCISTALYCLESLQLNISELNKLDNMLFNAFFKIFKISDRNSLKICMYYLNFLPIKYELVLRRIKFLFKCSQTENIIVSVCYKLIGSFENECLCNDYKLNSNNSVKSCIWKVFHDGLIF